MDDIVTRAMAKWPNVPHCYGWLMLDARGHWRMRNEAAQAQDLPGDRIAHAALLAFINRNYTHDDRGRWYFQNGPQRVYVNLEATPFIARTDGAGVLRLHTGDALDRIDAAWFTEQGQLIVQSGEQTAQLDDRDLGECLPMLRQDGQPLDDAALLAWVDGTTDGALTLEANGQSVPVRRIAAAEVAQRFGFVQRPQPD